MSGGGETEEGGTAGAAGPTAASPDSPPAAAPQDSLARPGRRRRGRTPGRGGCREPVPRATGPAALSDGRRLEQPSHKWRRASGARRKDVSALPAAVGGAPGSFPGYLRTHGRFVQRARSGGPGGCARPRWACDVGRGPGARGSVRGSLPWPSPSRRPRAGSAVRPGASQSGSASVPFSCRNYLYGQEGLPIPALRA